MVDKIIIENLSLQYADGVESLRDVSLNIRENAVTVLFGPADRKSTRLNSSHIQKSRMPSSA